MKKCVLTLTVIGVMAAAGFAQEKAAAPELFHARNGVVMGPVAAIDAAKNEIVIGDHLIKVGPAGIAGLKVGDEVAVEVHGSKVKVRKAGEKAAPRPFNLKGGGVAMGPVSAIDPAKNEIMIGDNIIKVSPADIARLKVGDDVTAEFRKGKTTIRKAGEKLPPEPFSGVAGHEMGPVEAVDAAKNELVVNNTIFKVTPADIAGLKAGDRVNVVVSKTGTKVLRVK
jgi:hypothetical protein